TGITLMKMDAGMDTGDMLEIFRTPIGEDETAGELSARLAELGARAVREGLPRFLRGEYTPQKQDGSLATTAPMLDKQHGRIDWTLPEKAVHDHVRGMNPWPMAFSQLAGKRVIVHRTRRIDATTPRPAKPGEVVLADKSRVWVACGQGVLELVRVQLEGKKPVSGVEWFLGRGVHEGDVLG
ncbi:MAG TPA: methionyl-tRNA formyltransferase, partial [Polyangiaceae bacterium]|nr:methionyl-tRNA formyltransferase [Polyangiaceae bacterium]